MKKSCIRCQYYLPCKDPKKSIIHFCDRFKVTNESLSQEKAVLEHLLGTPFVTSTLPGTRLAQMPSIDLSSVTGFDAFETLKSVLEDKRIVSPDIKIPEGDFKEAPNFYTWCISDEFLDQKPFVMQAMIGTKLFSEYCPTCSDTDWMENGVKVGDSLGKFSRKVALLEYGKCPYCHGTKLNFFRKGLLNPYYELALSAGQRCVVADTLVLSQDGLVEIGDYAGNRPIGFSDFGKDFNTGDCGMQTATKFYRAKPEYCKELKTKLGFSITGTNDHPVMTLDGFKRLAVVNTADYVRIYYGQKTFGNMSVVLRDVTEATDIKFLQWRASLKSINASNVVRPRRKPGYGKRNVYELDENLARTLGYWVAEGRHRGIANDDPIVLDDCYGTLTRMFGTDVIRRKSSGVEFTNTYVQMWLSELMDVDLHAGSAGKSVPRCILQASQSIQAAFLSALFEGDGGVSKKHFKSGTAYSLGYASISKRLVNQVSAMLLNLGIQHRRRVRKTWATNGSVNQVEKDCYCLAIHGSAMRTFQTEIGFRSSRKTALLAKAVEFTESRVNQVPFYYEKAPAPLHSEFHEVLRLAQAQLNQLPVRGSNATCFGLESIFGRGHRQFTRDGRSRTITKRDISSYIKPLLSNAFCFSAEVRARLAALVEFADGNYYYDAVVSNAQTAHKLETFDVTIPGAHRFISNGLLSHNSGKSALFGMMASYLTHRMIKLERPNEVFGLLKANVLQGTFVALTFAQAKDTLWEPFYGHLLEAPWYRNYHAMLDQVEGRHGDEAVYRLKDTFVFYRHRRIQVYPAGPDKRVLRGRTRFVSGVDELGWFPNTADAAKNVKMNATEVYIALERSLLTVRAKAKQVVKSGFYNVPFGYFINISSPSSVRDKIMELVRKSQGSTRTLGLCVPTWKMNPHVPRSALSEEFRNDPVAAMRDYGAEPPLTNSPFISSPDKIEICFSKKPHSLSIIYRNAMSRDKSSSELYAELDKLPASGKPSILALDAGLSNNSFAFTIGNLSKTGNPVISVVGEVMPAPGIRINHSLLYTHLLALLVERRNIKLVCADRWNSLKVLADMEQEFDIAKRQYSLKYADMQLFKSYIDDQQLLLPRPKQPIVDILKYDHSKYPECFKHLPADHLALQALTVQDTGSAVLKGDGLTDDILRSAMLCFRMLVDEENLELLNGPEEEAITERIDITKFAVSRNYSGGGSGSGSPTSNGGQGSNLGVLKQRQ